MIFSLIPASFKGGLRRGPTTRDQPATLNPALQFPPTIWSGIWPRVSGLLLDGIDIRVDVPAAVHVATV
jgi:hypothetical protein